MINALTAGKVWKGARPYLISDRSFLATNTHAGYGHGRANNWCRNKRAHR